MQSRARTYLILHITVIMLFVNAVLPRFVYDKNVTTDEKIVIKAKEVFDELVQGPLKESILWLVIDPSLQIHSSLFLNSTIVPLFLLNPSYENTDWTKTLLPKHIQRTAVMVLLLSKVPNWLQTIDLMSYFVTVLIIDVSVQNDSEELMNIHQLQRARQLALIEFTPTTQNNLRAYVFSSFPLARDSGGRMKIKERIGEWNASVYWDRKALFPERFKSLNGEVLHVSSDINDFPFITGKSIAEVEGINIMILKTLENRLNFTFTMTKRAPDRLWGTKVNGSWNGLLGEIQKRNKNLTINYFTLTRETATDFDYSKSYFFEGHGIALTTPRPFPPWMSTIYPFKWITWLCLVISIGLCALLTYLFYWTLKEYMKKTVSFVRVIFYTFMPLLQQSSPWEPTLITLRLLLAFWWIACFLVSASYIGNLVAILTVPVFPEKIQTVRELANSKLSVAMVDYGDFIPKALPTSPIEDLRKIGEKLILLNYLEDEHKAYQNLVTKMINDDIAIMETSSYLRWIISKHKEGKSRAYILKEKIFSGNLVFFYPKHTPWKHRLDDGITRLIEGGLIKKWYDQYMDSLGLQEDKTKQEIKPLTLYQLQSPFLLLIFGLGVSCLVFVIEFII